MEEKRARRRGPRDRGDLDFGSFAGGRGLFPVRRTGARGNAIVLHGYRYDRAKDYATLDAFPVEGVTADKVELHWISGRVEIRAAERITVSEDFAGDDAQRLRWRLDGDTLIVQPCASGAQELPEKTLTVTLPQTVLLKVDTVSADCA